MVEVDAEAGEGEAVVDVVAGAGEADVEAGEEAEGVAAAGGNESATAVAAAVAVVRLAPGTKGLVVGSNLTSFVLGSTIFSALFSLGGGW